MTAVVNYWVSEGVAHIDLDSAPVNGLGQGLRQALQNHYRQAQADPEVEAIVIGSAQKVFCAGADINEFAVGGFDLAPQLPGLLCEIEASSKIVVAAINGAALGGGLELALACDYRFAHPRAKLSLPEVNLGLIPGAGGSQRLPRLIDPALAAEMVATAKMLTAVEAEQQGLVDRLFDDSDCDDVEPTERFLHSAEDFARALVADGAAPKSCADISVDMTVEMAALPADFFAEFRQRTARSHRGFDAPQRAIDAVEYACHNSLADGLTRETELFEQCQASPQARAQQHLFFAQRAANQIPDVAANTVPRSVERVAIIGAGTMGGGIAMNFLNAGMPVVLLEQKAEALNRGIAAIDSNYQRSVDKGRLSADDMAARMALLTGTLDYADLAEVDMVIEAVFEDLPIKQQVFKKLDQVCKPGAILASNTSTLDVDAIAAVTSRPADVIGLHFFSPANVMKLLEIVRGSDTADDVLVTALQLARRIGKTAVVAGVCWGFIGNRVLEPYGRESARLILEGATPAQIDRAQQDFGLAMGFPSMIDMAGIDVGYLTRQNNLPAFAADPGYQAICNTLFELGRYGQKTGRGFYAYEGRQPSEDPELMTLAAELAFELNIAPREISDREILERSIFMLINEAAQVLADGIAYRASDIDLVYCNGYGFPAWRGGPLQYADEIGLDTVVAALAHYRRELGDYGELWFSPAPLLKQLAADGKTFKDYDLQNTDMEKAQ